MSQSRRVVAVIPACGRATRLAPYPSPKELYPIGWQDVEVKGRIERRPKVVSQFLVDSLYRADPDTVYMVIGSGKQDLMAYYSPPRFPASVAFVYRESTPSMVHTIDAAFTWTRDATVLFGMPDTVVEPEDAFVRLLAHHREHSAALTLGVFPTDEPHRFGMVDVRDGGRIVAHHDKPASTHLHAMWGIAVWEPSFTALLHDMAVSPLRQDREVVLGDAIDRAIEQGWLVHGVSYEDGRYIDVGSDAGIRLALASYTM